MTFEAWSWRDTYLRFQLRAATFRYTFTKDASKKAAHADAARILAEELNSHQKLRPSA